METENNTNQTEQAVADNMEQPNLLSETQSTTTEPAETTTADESRPAWLPEKFKTAEDLAKSYSELEKKIADQPKAPEQYQWDFVDNMDLQVNTDQETVKEAEQMFKSLGMTQKQVEGVVALYKDQLDIIDGQMAQQQGPQVDLEQQNALLKQQWGSEYENKLSAVKKFASKFSPTMLTQPLANTAEGLQLMYDMMESGRTPNPITDGSRANVSDLDIREKIRAMRNDEKMNLPQGDPIGDQFRNELYAQYERLSRLGK
jgi:hypothetical protein